MGRIELILNECRNKKVLDVGCGGMGGRLHASIKSVAEEVVGIEKDEDLAKRVGGETVVADAMDFDLNEKFDVIVAGELIEHLDNPAGFLKSVKKHLRPNGRLILTTPNLQSLYNILYLPYNEQHVIGFNRSVLKNLLIAHGFDILEMQIITHDNVPLHRKVIGFFLPRRLDDRIFCISELKETK